MRIALCFTGIAATCPPLLPSCVKTFYLDIVGAVRGWLPAIGIDRFRVYIERPTIRWARHPRHGFVRFRAGVNLEVIDRQRFLRDLNGSGEEGSGMDAGLLPACFMQACLQQRDSESLIVSQGEVIGIIRLDTRTIRRRLPACRRRKRKNL